MPTTVQDVLKRIGIKINYTNDAGFGQFTPPYRNTKSLVGASINLKTGWTSDWSEGSSFPIDVLVKRCKGKSLTEDELELFGELNNQDLDDLPQSKNYWSKESLAHLLPNHEYWVNRGISKETLRFFKGGLSHQGKLYNRYVWPVFDRQERITGFTGRDIYDTSDIKYKHEGSSRHFLFGVFNKNEEGSMPILDSIIQTSTVVLVEGPSDSVAAFDDGLYNCIPCFGLKISNTVLNFILALDLKRVIIAFNRDKAKENWGGDAAVKAHAKLADHFDITKLQICFPEKNDLMDSKGHIQEWYEQAFNQNIIESSLLEYRAKYRRNKKKFSKQEMKIAQELSRLSKCQQK